MILTQAMIIGTRGFRRVEAFWVRKDAIAMAK